MVRVANDNKPFSKTTRYIPLLDLWNWMYPNFCETLKMRVCCLIHHSCLQKEVKVKVKVEVEGKVKVKGKKRYHEERRLFLCKKRFHHHYEVIRDGTSCTLLFILITKKMDLTWQPLSSHYKAPIFGFETKRIQRHDMWLWQHFCLDWIHRGHLRHFNNVFNDREK